MSKLCAKSITPLYQRLRFLRNLEGLNVLLLPLSISTWWIFAEDPCAWWVRFPPLLLVIFIVAQGAFYWHLKLRRLRCRKPFPRWFCTVFLGLYWITIAGLILAPLGSAVRLLQGDRMNASDVAWGGGLYVFAILELVNYYHWQLTHDTQSDWRYLWRNRRLRRAALADDLRVICAGR